MMLVTPYHPDEPPRQDLRRLYARPSTKEGGPFVHARETELFQLIHTDLGGRLLAQIGLSTDWLGCGLVPEEEESLVRCHLVPM